MRVFLTVQERNELRNHAAKNPKLTQTDLAAWVARTYGKEVGRSSIGKILQCEKEVSLNPKQQKRRASQYPEMEEQLYAFVLSTEDDAVLSDELLCTKANSLLHESGLDAQVPLSWVQKFKWRHGIKRRKMHGESGSVHQSSLQEKRVELQTLIENYAPEDVYNFDETGLFYRRERGDCR